ncbi:MAG: hypothetical protein PHN69_06560 [Candidatus Pacebacteria bacterium]|nr:hypothetical protein [Candidatus Paceibacterota bacterium]
MSLNEFIRDLLKRVNYNYPEACKYYEEALDKTGSKAGIETFKAKLRNMRREVMNGKKGSEAKIFTPRKTVTDTDMTDEKLLTKEPKTLADVEELFGVDTSVWECKEFTCSNWDNSTKTNYAVRAKFKPRVNVINYAEILEMFKRDVTGFKVPNTVKPVKLKTTGNLLEICIFDIHLGKLGWGVETGEDYDHKIACERFMDVLSDHITSNTVFGFERILFTVGNDFFNFDTITGTTTGGTPQSNDLRWQKMFDVGVKLLVEGITYLSKYAPVDVMYVPGNHDQMTSFYATMYLDAWFSSNKRVEVDISPMTRKYRKWGNCLIGFTHGDKEKRRIDGIMQVEASREWGNTKFREWHIGHLHSEHVREVNGVIIRNISSITGSDTWHFESGYVGAIKKSPSFLWNKEDGLLNIRHSVIKDV